jgi:hypothetical protein
MDHWHAALPSDRFLDVDYDAIVAVVESQARRLVVFCGLPWDDTVLRYAARRSYTTPGDTAFFWRAPPGSIVRCRPPINSVLG